MAQVWNLDVVRDIRNYLSTGDESFAKTPLKRGFLCPSNKPDGLKYKLTSSGEKFIKKYG